MSEFSHMQFDLGAESQDEAKVSMEMLDRKANQIQQKIDALLDSDSSDRALLSHELAAVQVDMEMGKAAWKNAFPAFKLHIDSQQWQKAVIVCDTLFRSDQQDSLIALGHALWLSITFPVDPGLTVSQLQYVIDDTPEDSDGAAVAAATATYVVNLRSANNSTDDTTLAAGQMLNQVARRHGNAHTQEEFDQWFKRLELDDPGKFLVRMRNIIDVLVQGQWWIDRNALQGLIPTEN